MTRAEVDRWMRRYGAAWEERDGEMAAALFTEDGVYCWGPFEEPLRGRAAIRERWSRATETQRDVAFRHEILGGDGDRAFVRWWSSFAEDSLERRMELDGIFVLDFTGGVCAGLQEWWLVREAG